jgi:hypothetical protein
MSIDLENMQPMVALVCGVATLLVPRLQNPILAFYLTFVGISAMWPGLLH